jgi:hypothetical protein
MFCSPKKLVSLWDMIQFFFKKFDFDFWLLELLTKRIVEIAEADPNKKLSAEDRGTYSRALLDMKGQCEKLEMKDSHKRLMELKDGLEGDWHQNCSGTAELFKSLVQTVKDEVKGKKFAFIPASKVRYFERCALFGRAVNKAFPSARDDIKDAGNSLAADLHTAAVFHLMRVVNIGLRALARSLGIKKIGGKVLEYCRDEKIISEIETAIGVKLESVGEGKRGEKWEKKNAFYRGLLVDLRYFKDVIRDPMAHARKNYNESEAVGVFQHVHDFMGRLATRVSE